MRPRPARFGACSRAVAPCLAAAALVYAAPAGAAVQPAPPGQQQAPVLQQDAARALGREAALLLALGAFAEPGPARLSVATAPVVVPEGDRDELMEALREADADAAQELAALGGTQLSPDVRTALSPLPAEQLSAVEQGRTLPVAAETYLRALDQLVRYGGRGAGQPPDLPAVAAALEGVGVEPVEAGSSSNLLAAGVAAALAAAAAWWLLRRRARPQPQRRPSPQPTAAPSPPSAAAASTPAAGSMHDLLDASRRLTSASSTGDIDRMVVREALGLVSATGAALLLVHDGALALAAESERDLLVPEELERSTLRRVADTGQFHVQVSATERAIRNLPAALVALPLVGGGRVVAVLVVVRPDSRPFTPAECDVLHAYGPVAAAALHSAGQARATIEDGLVDGLTGVGNRRRFDRDLDAALREEGSTALVIVDLDHFKAVNDTHGHPAGDALLREVGLLLRTHVRPGDSVYRFGGEEFCVVLHDSGSVDAAEVAERVRSAVQNTAFRVAGPEPLSVTASFGVADTQGGSAADLLSRADGALYRAKHGGRNRVGVAAG